MDGIEPFATNLDMQPKGTTLHTAWNCRTTLDSDGKYVYTLSDGAPAGTVRAYSPRLGRPCEIGDIIVCAAVVGDNDFAASQTFDNCSRIENRQIGDDTWIFVGRSHNESQSKALNVRDLKSVKILASALYSQADYEKILSLSISLPYYPIFDGDSKRR